MTDKTETPQTNETNAPDWVVKTVKRAGRNSKLERIGVAWNRNKDGGICIRTAGTQIIANDIYLFPAATEASDGQDN